MHGRLPPRAPDGPRKVIGGLLASPNHYYDCYDYYYDYYYHYYYCYYYYYYYYYCDCCCYYYCCYYWYYYCYCYYCCCSYYCYVLSIIIIIVIIIMIIIIVVSGLSESGTRVRTAPARSSVVWQGKGRHRLPDGLGTNVVLFAEGPQFSPHFAISCLKCAQW